ncbi:MAG: hypothetical protein ABI377_06030 [Devosia sp.]
MGHDKAYELNWTLATVFTVTGAGMLGYGAWRGGSEVTMIGIVILLLAVVLQRINASMK